MNWALEARSSIALCVPEMSPRGPIGDVSTTQRGRRVICFLLVQNAGQDQEG